MQKSQEYDKMGLDFRRRIGYNKEKDGEGMKIIASDYDGTLNRRGIPDHVRAAILKWQALGNRFGIVSGRGIYNLLSVVRHDNMACDYLIANNGAVLADGEGNIISYHTGDPSVSGEIAAFVIENGCGYACLNDLKGDLFLCSEEEKKRRADDGRFSAISDYLTPIAFTQISTVLPSEEEAESLTQRINSRFAHFVTAFRNGICIDIVPKGIDKAEGIKELAALWGVSYEDICTVGDNYNDVAMLKAYRSYAVANAVEEVKSIANTVVTDIGDLIERELAL